MSRTKTYIAEIGNIEISRTKKAKRLTLRIIKYSNELKISVPSSYEFEDILNFLSKNKNKILAARKKMESEGEGQKIFDENTTFSTRKHKLYVIPENRADINTFVSQGKIKIFYPKNLSVTRYEVQDCIRKGITEALRFEAKEYLPKRVAELANHFGFLYNQVYIKNQRTRWGSCSSIRNINLNLNLMRLPTILIDYVILHELTHLTVQNHGIDFWNLLNKLTNNRAKELDDQINEININEY